MRRVTCGECYYYHAESGAERGTCSVLPPESHVVVMVAGTDAKTKMPTYKIQSVTTEREVAFERHACKEGWGRGE